MWCLLSALALDSWGPQVLITWHSWSMEKWIMFCLCISKYCRYSQSYLENTCNTCHWCWFLFHCLRKLPRKVQDGTFSWEAAFASVLCVEFIIRRDWTSLFWLVLIGGGGTPGGDQGHSWWCLREYIGGRDQALCHPCTRHVLFFLYHLPSPTVWSHLAPPFLMLCFLSSAEFNGHCTNLVMWLLVLVEFILPMIT